MAHNQTELWQMACTFQRKHNVWLQFVKSCIGLDVCWCGKSSWEEGIQTKSLHLWLPWWLVVCVWYLVEHQQSAQTAKLLMPQSSALENLGRRFLHASVCGCHKNHFSLPYLWAAVIFILVYLQSKCKGVLLLDLNQSNLKQFSRHTLCLSWDVDVLASGLGYKHFSTLVLIPVLLPYEQDFINKKRGKNKKTN